MQWTIADKLPASFREQFPTVWPVTLQLLYNRGITTPQQMRAFLRPDWKRDVHDPFLFLDMHRAVDRIFRAIHDGGHIKIFSDYDADGVTSGTVLYTTLESLGANNLSVYLPDRHEEGYGIQNDVIDAAIAEKTNLLITVDVGISAFSAVEKAMTAGIDVIICDHHHILNIPPAYAILHPLRDGESYPDPYLSGVGVAFKLAQGLLQSAKAHPSARGYSLFSTETSIDAFEKWLLDLVAIGTIADVVPLLGENRALVHFGLIVLTKTKRPGLAALIQESGLGAKKTSLNRTRLTPRDVSWVIAPRINAASRMDHASSAFQLLNAQNADIAQNLARELATINLQRKQLTDRILTEAASRVTPERHTIILASPDWPVSVCGLVAGRISDQYHIPVFLFEKKERDGDIRFEGSGRSIDGCDLMEILDAVKDTIMKYGGHAQACGLTIVGTDAFAQFSARVEQYVNNRFPAGFAKHLSIECVLQPKEVTLDLIDTLSSFEPFGERNPEPIFCISNLSIISADHIGKTNAHLRIFFSTKEGISLKGMVFNAKDGMISSLKPKTHVDVACTLEASEWNNTREVFLNIRDVRPAQEES